MQNPKFINSKIIIGRCMDFALSFINLYNKNGNNI